MACYLKKSNEPAIDEQRRESWGTIGIGKAMLRVRVYVTKRCGGREGAVAQCRRRHGEACTSAVVERLARG